MLGNNPGSIKTGYVRDYVVFDLETTGVSCKKDKVVEISAVKVEDGKISGEFSTLVNPGCPIPFHASQVNGITDDMVEDAPDFKEALMYFFEFAGDMVLVGHNIQQFDLKFIYRDSREYFGKIPENDYIDTLKLSRAFVPELEHHSLTFLAEHYGISTEGAHRALNDCRMNRAIYEILGSISEEKLKDIKKCPRCGNPLKKRKGKYGEFLGCSAYPQCRYTENIKDQS